MVSAVSAPVLKGRKRKRKRVVKNSDSDETVESETGSVSVATSSDIASPAKVTHCPLLISHVYYCCQLTHFVGNDGPTFLVLYSVF